MYPQLALVLPTGTILLQCNEVEFIGSSATLSLPRMRESLRGSCRADLMEPPVVRRQFARVPPNLGDMDHGPNGELESPEVGLQNAPGLMPGIRETLGCLDYSHRLLPE